MSEIKVNKITPRTGTTITLGDSGDSLSIASGVALTDFTSTGIDDNATSTALTIDSSQRVGIGTASPASKLEVEDSVNGDMHLRINNTNTGSSARTLLLLQSDGATGSLYLNGANRVTSGVDEADSMTLTSDASASNGLNINATSGSIKFYNNYSEKMRIDSSGNVLVGKTAIALATVGGELRADGQITGTKSGGSPLILNRTTSDGEIAQFYKDAVKVGSIGVDSSDNFYIGATTASHAGLYMWSNGVTPMIAGSQTDDTVNLGRDIYRWKNLYMSGNIYLGGTTSANALDDYEEGTFSPTYLGSTTNPSVTYDTTVRYGAYTKIGRIVYFNLVNRTDAVSSSGSGDLRVGGLPFNADNSAFSSVSRYGCNIGGFTGFSTSGSNMTGYIINNYIELFETQGASTVSTSELVDGGNRNEIQITGFYVTSS